MKKLFSTVAAIAITTFIMAQQGAAVGEKAPDFSAVNQFGKTVSLKETLKTGKVVVVFYRGYWCPNCMRALKSIQDSIAQLAAQNVTVIAVSPETKEGIAKTVKIANAQFSVISDEGLKILQAYKVAFAVTPDMDTIHKKYGIDVLANNGKNGHILPRPSAFIIDQNGIIIYRYFNNAPYSNPNSNSRITVKEILQKTK